jgi:hypothetical protein
LIKPHSAKFDSSNNSTKVDFSTICLLIKEFIIPEKIEVFSAEFLIPKEINHNDSTR